MSNRRAAVLVAVVALAAFYGGYLSRPAIRSVIAPSAANATMTIYRAIDPRYPLIQPLIATDVNLRKPTKKYAAIDQDISDFLAQKKAAIPSLEASVYFRNPLSGDWLGINETATYDPASMLKVPVMMAFFKQAEDDPSVLDKPVTYALAGKKTTEKVSRLIERMIIDSDNDAKDALLTVIDSDYLKETFTDLGIQYPDDAKGGPYVISVKTYAMFFRTLFNATYLSREMSNRALDLMLRVTFKEGLAAGLPPGVPLANKYGVHAGDDALADPTKGELHDCGIVYAPNQPYLLCVMTKGSGEKDLASVISGVSSIVYKAMTASASSTGS